MSRRQPKQRIDPAVKLALAIVPAAQVQNGRFRVVDIANRTERDQRHMVRSGEKRTVRRETHIEKLVRLRTLTPRQGQLCQWYADQREIGYATIGCTANYCGAGGGGFGAKDLLARYKEQANARNNYAAARDSVELHLLPLVEKIVVAGWGLGEAGNGVRPSVVSLNFRKAVEQLERGIGHLVNER